MDLKKYKDFGPTILRVFLGLLFLMPGFDKLMGLLGEGHMLIDMLGLPLTWVLAIVEIVFGIFLILGFKVEIASMALAIVMVGAIVLVVIPSFAEDPMAVVNLLFHLLAIAGLINVALSGPGKLAIKN